jgi:hypothetical protein
MPIQSLPNKIAFLVLVLLGCTNADKLQDADTGGTSDAGDGGSSASTSPCSPSTDTLRCDGRQVSYCECANPSPTDSGVLVCPSESYSWVKDTVCPVACDSTINTTSGCIDSAQPIPECAQDGYACWNGNMTYCSGGYPMATHTCTQCVSVSGCGIVCITDSVTLDSRCSATDWSGGFCENNTAYFCSCGYLTNTYVCGSSPRNCITESGPVSMPTCGLPP